ncbi:MAG: peptidylprolyl isomerase [Actinomycetales bacterium]|nr:peptidylprolyl isomerase [Actinomycetales bacterium]
MSPIKRDRAYERRRWENYQKKLSERRERQLRMRRVGAILGAVATIFVVVGGTYYLMTRGDDSSSTAAQPTPAPSASATPTTTAKNPCKPVTVTPPATPKSWASVPSKDGAGDKTWNVTLGTNCGDIRLSLDGEKAPQAVSSMLHLIKGDFYTGSACHRLTTDGLYVLQCGDPTGSGTGSPGYSYGPIENAPKNDVYPAGTIAMARQGNKGDSMGSQFFLVYKKSTIPSDSAGGYTILGKITDGLDIVKKIAAGGTVDGGGDGSPMFPIAIESAKAESE